MDILCIIAKQEIFRSLTKKNDCGVCRAIVFHIVESQRCHLLLYVTVIGSKHLFIYSLWQIFVHKKFGIDVIQCCLGTRGCVKGWEVCASALYKHILLLGCSLIFSWTYADICTTVVTHRWKLRWSHLNNQHITIIERNIINIHHRERQYIALGAY